MHGKSNKKRYSNKLKSLNILLFFVPLEHIGYYKHHIYNIKMLRIFSVTVHLKHSYDSCKTHKLFYKIALMNLK